MRSKLLGGDGERRFAVILGTGEEVVSALARFAQDQGLGVSGFGLALIRSGGESGRSAAP
jgi:predicted DNA-binding protein with PD1-like motif